MTIARRDLVNDCEEGTFHCVSRIVRRAFLCGWDALTQRDYAHRKFWVSHRLQEPAGIFTMDVCGYAVMENHLHVILRNRPDLARQASDHEIAEKCRRLYPKRRTPSFQPEEPTEAELGLVLDGDGRVEELRARLHSISWFMKSLKEYLARLANAEDGCTGRFWEGRFKSTALLDQAAVLTCTAYVDLNPIRAGLAETPETSDFTSAQDRTVARQVLKGKEANLVHLRPAEVRRCLARAAWLCPLRDTPQRRGFLNLDLDATLGRPSAGEHWLMKRLTVEIVEDLGEAGVWITGRCCDDDIYVGDILCHDGSPEVLVHIKRIVVYHKDREVLYHGYVGGVIVDVLQGTTIPVSGYLCSASGGEGRYIGQSEND